MSKVVEAAYMHLLLLNRQRTQKRFLNPYLLKTQPFLVLMKTLSLPTLPVANTPTRLVFKRQRIICLTTNHSKNSPKGGNSSKICDYFTIA